MEEREKILVLHDEGASNAFWLNVVSQALPDYELETLQIDEQLPPDIEKYAFVLLSNHELTNELLTILTKLSKDSIHFMLMLIKGAQDRKILSQVLSLQPIPSSLVDKKWSPDTLSQAVNTFRSEL